MVIIFAARPSDRTEYSKERNPEIPTPDKTFVYLSTCFFPQAMKILSKKKLVRKGGFASKEICHSSAIHKISLTSISDDARHGR